MVNRNMMVHLVWIAIVLPVALHADAALAEAFIVKDGKANAEIVIAEKPPRMVKLATEELQTYVRRITGAKLAIVTEPTGDVPVQVYVGKSPYTERLRILCDDLKHGAYRMVSGDNWLVLIGSDNQWKPKGLMKLAVEKDSWVTSGQGSREERPLWKEWDKITGEHWGLPFRQLWKQHNTALDLWAMDERGSFNAVAAFLRMQGVRWYMAGELGEIVPKKADIALPKVNETVRPDFELRYPYLYGQRFGQGGGDLSNLMWQLHMGFNQAPDVIGVGYRAHGIAHLISRPDVKKAHPEYYALIGGRRVTERRFAKRDKGVPCLSSPGLIANNVKFVRTMFDVFDMPMVSVMPVDGFTSICQCERCEGKSQPERGLRGQFSNYVWDYCNKVAKEVYKTHADRKIVGMAYTPYMLPPTNIEKLSPNLMVCIAQARCQFGQDAATRKFYKDLREAWLKKLPNGGKNLYMYDYYRYAVPGKSGQFTPAFSPHAIAQDLRDLKGISLGDYIEVYTRDARVITDLNVYVTGRYWWDADLDIDALLDQYYALFYGPTRDEMKAFIEYSEANWMHLKKVEKIDKVFELLTAAQTKAPEGSVYAKRIALIADYIEPLKDLRAQLNRPRDNVPRAVLVTRDDAEVRGDGKLDEPAWNKLRTYPLRHISTGKFTKIKTRFHIFWAKGSLYMGIVCEEPDMQNLNITATRDDDTSIWSGDEVEILIETQVHAYYQLCISPSGALLDVDHKNGLRTIWSSNAEVGVHHADEAWTVEVRIPVASEDQDNIDPNNGLAGRKPSNAYPWHFNVCRQRDRGGKRELWAFSPTGGGFQKPRKFAEMGGIIRDPKERARRKRLTQEWLKQWE